MTPVEFIKKIEGIVASGLSFIGHNALGNGMGRQIAESKRSDRTESALRMRSTRSVTIEQNGANGEFCRLESSAQMNPSQ